MRPGERQVAPSIDGIRQDHVARYQWADSIIPAGASVLDLGCGVGYGADLLARGKRDVIGVDCDVEALEYGAANYKTARYHEADLQTGWRMADVGKADYAVAFECIERIQKPEKFLRAVKAEYLLASVPNETHFPHGGKVRFHHRHYTEEQFVDLLDGSGWDVEEIRHQEGDTSAVGDTPGRTLVARCKRNADFAALYGKHVAIVGLGPSSDTFVDHCKRAGGASAYCDEIWPINALGDVLRADRIWHMDDVRVQESRAAAHPESNIARMIEWIKTHPGPIYTSHLEPGYPGLVEYPLQKVVKATGEAYFNGTVAYAVAYALYRRVGRISLFGCDYTYANSHSAERGRACLEYWIAIAKSQGVQITLPRDTSLMDVCDGPDALFYGYDGYKVRLSDSGGMGLNIEPRELPTAAEIEARYDHSKPANALVRAASEAAEAKA